MRKCLGPVMVARLGLLLDEFLDVSGIFDALAAIVTALVLGDHRVPIEDPDASEGGHNDQRPSRIDDEVRSQLANRLILSIKEPNDITSALAGIRDRSTWEGVVGAIPARTVLAVGDAIRVPTVIEIMEYNTEYMRQFTKTDTMDSGDIDEISREVDKIFE